MDDNEGTRQLEQLKQEVIDTGRRLRQEITFPVSDGPRTYAVVAEPVRDETGRVTGVATAALDITERKQVEERMAAQLDELRRWQSVVVGRETRLLELKREVNELLRRLNQPPRYPSAETKADEPA